MTNVAGPASRPRCERVAIDVGGVTLAGDLVIPDLARGLVLFAHGSGRGRSSRRDAAIARHLEQAANAATLMVDLLAPHENRTDGASDLKTDLPRIAERLLAVREWLAEDPRTRMLRVAYYGASTGAATALVAAATRTGAAAVVACSGRPDLAPKEALARVDAPTLFLLGGKDEAGIERNTEAQRSLKCETAIEVIPGCVKPFDDEQALAEVGRRTAAWMTRFL